jgi:carbonic anhydrase
MYKSFSTKLHLLSILIPCFILISGCKKEEETTQHWDYENTNWASLGYTDCAGTVQTPVDIVTSKTIKTPLEELAFNYNPFNISIVDNGHTVQVNKGSSVNKLTVDGVNYEFQQFHYHTHSEHAVDGSYHDMEVHLVHKDPVTGNLAVVAVFVEGEGTTENTFLNKYLSEFPAEEMIEDATATSINLDDILPLERGYYTYTGSLTTPPCTQGLRWIVLKEAVKASVQQIGQFEARHEINARPLQPLNNRFVLEKL